MTAQRSCPSELRWDALDAGELGDTERAALHGHASQCVACAARVERRRQRRASFEGDERLQAVPELLARLAVEAGEDPSVGTSAGAPLRRPLALGLVVAAAAVAAVAAAVLLVVVRPGLFSLGARPGGSGRPTSGALTVKGELSLTLHRATASGSVPLPTGAGVSPGSEIGFGVRSPVAGRAVLVLLDGAGVAQPLRPPGAPNGSSFALQAGATTLPLAVRLDATPGPARFGLLRCPGEPSQAARATLQVRLADPTQALGALQRQAGGCAVAIGWVQVLP